MANRTLSKILALHLLLSWHCRRSVLFPRVEELREQGLLLDRRARDPDHAKADYIAKMQSDTVD